MGLLADYVLNNQQRGFLEEDRLAREQGITSLMGQAPQEVPGVMGDMSGIMNQGSGLMGGEGMNDPQNRMEFSAGLMQLPGMQNAGAALMGQQYTQQQQAGQFDRTMEYNQQQATQGQQNYDRTFNEGVRQFDDSMQENRRQFANQQYAAGQSKPMTFSESKNLYDMQNENQTLFTGANNAMDLAKLFEEYGTENFDIGTNNRSSQMRFMRDQAMNSLRVLNEMGVLQKEEYERLADTLPETDAWIGGALTSNAGMAAPYKALAKTLEAKLLARINSMKGVGIDPGQLRRP